MSGIHLATSIIFKKQWDQWEPRETHCEATYSGHIVWKKVSLCWTKIVVTFLQLTANTVFCKQMQQMIPDLERKPEHWLWDSSAWMSLCQFSGNGCCKMSKAQWFFFKNWPVKKKEAFETQRFCLAMTTFCVLQNLWQFINCMNAGLCLVRCYTDVIRNAKI